MILSHYFNSHAHVERDADKTAKTEFVNISTHTLTWSVTKLNKTQKWLIEDFNSHAHVERDVVLIISERKRPLTISTHTLTWSVTLDVVYIWCLLNVMRTYFFI